MPATALPPSPSTNLSFVDRVLQAEQYVAAKQYDTALTLLHAMQASFPRSFVPPYRLGEVYRMQKKYEVAASHYEQALAIKPDETDIIKGLVFALIKLGRFEAVMPWLEKLKAQCTDPKEINAAQGLLNWALVGPNPVVQAMVRFDRNANHYDEGMQHNLMQPAPVIVERMRAHHPAQFERAIDLGCGTGKGGEALRPWCTVMVGVDASPRMLGVAHDKHLYDHLAACGLVEFLSTQAGQSHDLVYAAAVITYFKDLDPVFAQVRRVLTPDGLLAFDATDAPADVASFEEKSGLMSLQHVHNPQYVIDTAARWQLSLVERSSHVFQYMNSPEASSIYLFRPMAVNA